MQRSDPSSASGNKKTDDGCEKQQYAAWTEKTERQILKR